MLSDDFNKKKRKRSTYQRLKINAKKGRLSKGRQLSEEEHSYYLNLMGQLRNVEEDEKEIIIQSFFREFNKDGRQKELASNQLLSRMLDELLPSASTSDYLMIFEELSKDLRIICTDPFASHVLQTLLLEGLKRCQACVAKDEGDGDTSNILSDADGIRIVNCLEKACKFSLNNFEDFIFDTYASHVVRTILEVVSATPSSQILRRGDESESKHKLSGNKSYIVPKELAEILPMFIDRFISRSDFINDIATSNCASAVIQNLLAISGGQNKNMYSVVIKGLFDSQPGDSDQLGLHPVFYSSPAMLLLQAAISHSPKKQQMKIYNLFFKDKIDKIVTESSAFFALQTLLKDWKNPETFEEIFEAMDDSILSSAFNERKFGVILALVQGCGTLETSQNKCIKKIMKMLDCKDKENHVLLVPLLVYMITRDHFIECDGNFPNTEKQGAFVVQELIKYKNNKKVVDSLLALSSSQLETLCCDPKASHIITTFACAPNVSDKSKMLLVEKLRKRLTGLAVSKFGSYCLERLFEAGSVKCKTWMCEELCKDEIRIKEDRYGVIVYNKLKVGLFSHRKDKSDWETLVSKQDKKRKLVQEIFEAAEKGIKQNKLKEESGAKSIYEGSKAETTQQIEDSEKKDKKPRKKRKRTGSE